MRIAFITETFPPEINGVSLTTARAVHHLRRAGHTVQLIRPRQSHEATHAFEDTEPPGDHTFDNGEWRTAGAPIPMHPGLRFGWATVNALRERWQQSVPQLVHVATPGPLAWSALRAAKAEGVPSTADFRTNLHAYAKQYGLGWLQPAVLAYLRQLHNMAHRTFVPTRSLADELAARGFQRPSVIGRGVDAGVFSPAERDDNLREAWGVGPGDRVLLYVGRLAAEKNVGLALDTFEYLRCRHPTLRMVVAGEGPLRAKADRRHHLVASRQPPQEPALPTLRPAGWSLFANSSATNARTARRRCRPTTSMARRPIGTSVMSVPTPAATRGKTGPRPGPTTCTCATRWTPRAASASMAKTSS